MLTRMERAGCMHDRCHLCCQHQTRETPALSNPRLMDQHIAARADRNWPDQR